MPMSLRTRRGLGLWASLLLVAAACSGGQQPTQQPAATGTPAATTGGTETTPPDESPDATGAPASPDASPQGSPQGSPQAGDGSITYAIDGEITYLSNANSDVPTAELMGFIYSAVYRYNASLEPVPDMAEDFAEISEDGTEWTVTLVDNATFQPSGNPVTADDVVFTYQLANSPNCRFNPSICLGFVTVDDDQDPETDPVPVLENVEAVDERTVRFTLAAPYAPFATVVLPGIGIDEKAAVEASFATFQENTADVEDTAIEDLSTRITAETETPTGEPAEPGGDPTPNLVQFRPELEELLTQADIELPDQAQYPALDENGEPTGELDEVAYTDALIATFNDLQATLEAEAQDQIAAAYPLLDYSRGPSTAGPFYITEFRPGQDVTAQANPGYHHGEPNIKTMFFPIIKDDVAGSSALVAGDIDWKYSLTADAYAQVQNDENIQIAEYPDFGYYGIQFNLREGQLFDTKEARQAAAYCFDKDATVAAATSGQGVPVYADIPPASWAYNPDVPKYGHDPAKGNQLLDEAGIVDNDGDGVREHPSGRVFGGTILARAGRPDRVRFMQLWADAMNQDCGSNFTVEEADFATVLLPGLEFPHIFPGQNKPWDAYFGGWGTSFDPDPYSIWHSSQCTNEEQPDLYNYICYQNPEADRLIEEGLRELDQDARAEIYREFQQILAEDQPYLFAWSDIAREGLRTSIGTESEGGLQLDTPTFFWEVEKLTNAQ